MQQLQSHEFELPFLEGWRDASQVVLIGPERPVFTPNLQVHREQLGPDESAEEFFRQQRAELAQLDGFRLIEHGDRKLAGQTALSHSYSWSPPELVGSRIRQTQLALTYAGTLFTITASALEHEWESIEPAFEHMLSGFRWR